MLTKQRQAPSPGYPAGYKTRYLEASRFATKAAYDENGHARCSNTPHGLTLAKWRKHVAKADPNNSTAAQLTVQTLSAPGSFLEFLGLDERDIKTPSLSMAPRAHCALCRSPEKTARMDSI